MSLIKIENRCNQNCVFCSFEPERQRGKIEIASIFDDIKRSKEKLVQISGGEPFLTKPAVLLEILLCCLKNKKKVEIQTNASLIEGYDAGALKKIARIVKVSGGYFNVNISAANPKLDRKITQKDFFYRKISGVNLLLKLEVAVRITHIICELNYRYLPGFARFVKEKMSPRVGWVQFSFVKAMGKARTRKIVPKYSSVSGFLSKACYILKRSGIEFEIDHIPPCMLGRYYGYHVDIAKMKLKIPGPQEREKTYVKKCFKCKYANICYGPRKDYLKIHKVF